MTFLVVKCQMDIVIHAKMVLLGINVNAEDIVQLRAVIVLPVYVSIVTWVIT